jgi:hypothetical protein
MARARVRLVSGSISPASMYAMKADKVAIDLPAAVRASGRGSKKTAKAGSKPARPACPACGRTVGYTSTQGFARHVNRRSDLTCSGSGRKMAKKEPTTPGPSFTTRATTPTVTRKQKAWSRVCSQCRRPRAVDHGLIVPHRQPNGQRLCSGSKKAPLSKAKAIFTSVAMRGARSDKDGTASRSSKDSVSVAIGSGQKRSMARHPSVARASSPIPLVRTERARKSAQLEDPAGAAREDLNYKGSSSVPDRPGGLPGLGKRR